MCVRRCPAGHACLHKAPQPPPGRLCVSLPPFHPRGTAPRAAKACLGTLCFKHLEARLLGLGQFPWKRVSKPEATRKAATRLSGRPGPAAWLMQVAWPRQAGDTPATQSGPRCSQGLLNRRRGLCPACALGPARRAGEAGPVSQGPGLAGAWRPRPAHLLGDPGLQLPADVAPGHAVQVLQLAQQQQGPALGVRVPGARLELQPHARHLAPCAPGPAASTQRPASARLGAAPVRPASAPRLPRRCRAAPSCRAHPGREGAPAEAGRRPHCLPGHRWGRVAREPLEWLQLGLLPTQAQLIGAVAATGPDS